MKSTAQNYPPPLYTMPLFGAYWLYSSRLGMVSLTNMKPPSKFQCNTSLAPRNTRLLF